MKYVLDGKQMQEVDNFSIKQVGIPSLVLMERAALTVCEVIKKKYGTDKKILAVNGTGNNGADAVACARILMGWGYEAAICSLGDTEKYTIELQQQLAISDKMHIKRVTIDSLGDYDVIIDGIFGIGLSRNIEGNFVEIIEDINKSGKEIVSVDIPSGINSATGQIMNVAIEADVTVTFGYLKTGLILYPGNTNAGNIIIGECGFAPEAVEQMEEKKFVYDDEDLKRIPVRRPDSNKGTCGKILVVAGSENMSGAAYFSGKAAYRTGAGLVRILTTKSNKDVIQKILPEAVLVFQEDMNKEKIENNVKWAESIVIGPGLSTDEKSALLLYSVMECLENSDKKILLDADALNIISRDKKHTLLKGCVITPHIGEMSRLTGLATDVIKKDIIGLAKQFAKENECICVLKDARTIVTDGIRLYINISGNNGMATAGSGDVLTGIIAGLWGNGMDLFEGAVLGTYIHGCAGDVARNKMGEYSMKADDIADSISQVIHI